MSQIAPLYDTLKQQLKASSLTYRDIATALSLSEANIKRLFASRSFSLERLEQICALLGITLADAFIRWARHLPELAPLPALVEYQGASPMA